MGQSYSVYLKAKIKDEDLFVKLSTKSLEGCYGGQHDMTTPIGNIKFLLADNQKNFSEETENGWSVYRSDFDASYGWEFVLDQWFNDVAPALDDGSEIEVYPDRGHWGYEVINGEAV